MKISKKYTEEFPWELFVKKFTSVDFLVSYGVKKRLLEFLLEDSREISIFDWIVLSLASFWIY